MYIQKKEIAKRKTPTSSIAVATHTQHIIFVACFRAILNQ